MSRLMKTAPGLLVAGALLAVFAVPAGLRFARAEDAKAADAAQPAAAAETAAAADTELAKQMEVIEDGMKKLRRTLKNAEGDAESLKTIGAMQAAAVASKELTPARLAKVPEDQKKTFLAGYRKDMAAMIVQFCEMETAVLDGKHDEAQAIHKKLKDVEEEGHEKYAEEG